MGYKPTGPTYSDVNIYLGSIVDGDIVWTERNDLVKLGSVTVEYSLTSPDVAAITFNVDNADPTAIPAVYLPLVEGQPIKIVHSGSTRQFGGTIDTIDMVATPSTGKVNCVCKCVSWDRLKIKRRAWIHTYTNQYLGDIFSSLILNCLDNEGVSAEVIPGPIIPSFSTDPSMSVEDAMKKACQLATDDTDTYYSFIDWDRKIYLAKQSTYPAPWSIDDRDDSDGNALHGSEHQIRVERSLVKFANVSLAQAAKLIGDAKTETFRGDGANQIFTLTKPVAAPPTIMKYTTVPVLSEPQTFTADITSEPAFDLPHPIAVIESITLAGSEQSFSISIADQWYYTPGQVTVHRHVPEVSPEGSLVIVYRWDTGSTAEDPLAQTVGVAGVDTGKDWYYNIDSNTISQDSGGTPISGTQSISVTFQGYSVGYSRYVFSSSVASRAGIEGGTGIYEAFISIDTPITQNGLDAAAKANTEKFGVPPNAVTIVTMRPGLATGQLIPIHLDEYNIDGNFLIDTLTMEVIGAYCYWTAHCISGALVGDIWNAWAAINGGPSLAGGSVNIPNQEQVPTPGAIVEFDEEAFAVTLTDQGNGQVAIDVEYAPPSPIGSFIGVYGVIETPDYALQFLTDVPYNGDGTSHGTARFLVPWPAVEEYWFLSIGSYSRAGRATFVKWSETNPTPWRQIHLVPPVKAPTQPTAVELTEQGPRVLDTLGRVRTTMRATLTGAGSGADRAEVRIAVGGSEKDGVMVGPLVNPIVDGVVDFSCWVPEVEESWVAKVSVASGTAANPWSTAVSSDPYLMQPIGTPISTGVTNAELGALSTAVNADGVAYWGSALITWDEPTNDATYWRSYATVQKGKYVAAVWTPATDYEGVEREFLDQDHIPNSINYWLIPPADSDYVFRIRIYSESRSRLSTLQNCWSGTPPDGVTYNGTYAEITVTAPAGAIDGKRVLAPLGPGLKKDIDGNWIVSLAGGTATVIADEDGNLQVNAVNVYLPAGNIENLTLINISEFSGTLSNFQAGLINIAYFDGVLDTVNQLDNASIGSMKIAELELSKINGWEGGFLDVGASGVTFSGLGGIYVPTGTVEGNSGAFGMLSIASWVAGISGDGSAYFANNAATIDDLGNATFTSVSAGNLYTQSDVDSLIADFAAESWVTTQISDLASHGDVSAAVSDMATQTWVDANYFSGGDATAAFTDHINYYHGASKTATIYYLDWSNTPQQMDVLIP